MKLSVDFDRDIKIIPEFANYGSVESLYVKLSDETAEITNCNTSLRNLDELKETIKAAHRIGIKVKYIEDATCRSNREYTKKYNDMLLERINEVVSLGIDGIVISSPFMLGYVKENWPGLETTASRFATVDTIEKAKFWVDRGADKIVLSMVVGRDFEMIQRIRAAVGCELEMIANLGCLYSCPDERFHGLFTSHSTSSNGKGSEMPIDYYSINCSVLKMNDMTELIKSRWIRPEDVDVYEKVGISSLKIVSDPQYSSTMMNTVKAYNDKKYNGNLMDIIYIPGFCGLNNSSQDFKSEKEFDCGAGLNQEVLQLLKDKKDISVNIENAKLNNFIDHFLNFNCSKAICGVDCNYCQEKGIEVMTYNQDEVNKNKENLLQIIDKIHGNKLFNCCCI